MGNTETQEEIQTLESLIQDVKQACEQLTTSVAIVRMDEDTMAVEAEFPNGTTMFYPMPICEADTDLTTYFLYNTLLSHVAFASVWTKHEAENAAQTTIH